MEPLPPKKINPELMTCITNPKLNIPQKSNTL